MFKNILFDIDGTLVNSEKAIINSLQKVLKEEFNLEKKYDDLLFVLGVPGIYSLKQLDIPNNKISEISNKWSDYIFSYSDEMKLYPDVEFVLNYLYNKNINLGIVTSKDDCEMTREFNNFGLNKYFNSIVTSSSTKLHKPNPDPILKAMDNLNANKKDTIYIGDSVYDMKSAKSSGISFGLASWGAVKNIHNVDYYLKELKDILNLIK